MTAAGGSGGPPRPDDLCPADPRARGGSLSGFAGGANLVRAGPQGPRPDQVFIAVAARSPPPTPSDRPPPPPAPPPPPPARPCFLCPCPPVPPPPPLPTGPPPRPIRPHPQPPRLLSSRSGHTPAAL